jgi:hypothetical protein
MDGATLQARIYAGYAKAALRIGLSFSQYRPTAAAAPITAPYLLRSLLASFNAMDFKYGRPNLYGKATWYCIADGTLLQVGDYLTGNGSTYFIAAMQPLLPILVVECNRTVTLYRPQQQTGVGAVGYGGNTAANETVLASGFPASVLQGTKGEHGDTRLPGDVRNPWWSALLPNIPGGITLRTNDVMTDETGQRYTLSSAEQTDLGWRLTVMQAET